MTARCRSKNFAVRQDRIRAVRDEDMVFGRLFNNRQHLIAIDFVDEV